MVERIRSLLARFSENEDTVRWLVAADVSFDALCHEYRKVSDSLEAYETQSRRLRERKAFLARFSENEGTEPRLAAADTSFEALHHVNRKVIDFLQACEMQSRRLRDRKAFLEEELLARIEGYRPQ
jgi:hypothetical protein